MKRLEQDIEFEYEDPHANDKESLIQVINSDIQDRIKSYRKCLRIPENSTQRDHSNQQQQLSSSKVNISIAYQKPLRQVKLISKFDKRNKSFDLNDSQRDYQKQNILKALGEKAALESVIQQNYKPLHLQNLPELEKQSGFKRRDLIQLYSHYLSIFRIQQMQRQHLRSNRISDLNGVDLDVFIDNVPAIKYENNERALKIIDIIQSDIGNNNQITWEKFLQYLKLILADTVGEKIDLFLQAFDANKNNSLNWKEVENICKSCLQQIFSSQDEFVDSLSFFFTKYVFDVVNYKYDQDIPIETVKKSIKSASGEQKQSLLKKQKQSRQGFNESFNTSHNAYKNTRLTKNQEIQSDLQTKEPQLNAFERLSSLAAQSSNIQYCQNNSIVDKQDFVIKNNKFNPYVGANQRGRNLIDITLSNKALSTISGKRKSLIANTAPKLITKQINQIDNKSQERSSNLGKKKRKRFNETLDEVVTKQSIISQKTIPVIEQNRNHFKNQEGLNQSQLSKLPSINNVQNDELISQFTQAATKMKATKISSRSHSVCNKSNKNYRDKILGLINKLDDKQLEKLQSELECNNDENQGQQADQNQDDNQDKEINNEKECDQKDSKTVVTQNMFDSVSQHYQNDDQRTVTTEQRSQKTNKTSSTMLLKLQRELDEEKKAREQLKNEIEQLKKMNNELCNAILSSDIKK